LNFGRNKIILAISLFAEIMLEGIMGSAFDGLDFEPYCFIELGGF